MVRSVPHRAILLTAALLSSHSVGVLGQVERLKELVDAADIVTTLKDIFGAVSDGASAAGPIRIDEGRLASIDQHITSTNARMPAAPPPTPVVSMEDVANDTRGPQALARMEKYADDRRQYSNNLQQDRRQVEAELRDWEQRDQRVRRTTNSLGKLMGDPRAATLFQLELGFAWFDYETQLMPRVADVLNAYRKLLARYDAALEKTAAENRNFENNLALLREARKSRDIDRKVTGAWLTTLDVDFDCETIRGTGTATVRKGAGSGEYRSTENMHYRRTLKPGCKAIPGYRREFDDQSETVWVVGQNTITVIDDPSYRGPDFGTPDSHAFSWSGSTLTATWTYDGGAHHGTYTKR